MGADPTNVDLYQGADQALSLLGRPTAERIAALSRYPDRAQMPRRAAPAARPRPGRGRPRGGGEGAPGRALLRARGGRHQRAPGVRRDPAARRRWPWPGPAAGRGRAGHRGGARPRSAGLRLHEGRPGRLRGRAARAVRGGRDRAPWPATTRPRARHWQKATEGREAFFRALPYAYAAARRLGGADEAAWRARLEASRRPVGEVPRSGHGLPRRGGDVAGPAAAAPSAARTRREARFRRALLLPDQRLSHLVSRRALQDAKPF